MDHVVRAFAQIRILKLLELLNQLAHLLRDRPLGVAALRFDHALGLGRKLRIGQDHPMHIEKCAKFSGRIGALHAFMQGFKFGAYCRQRDIETSQFRGHLIGRDVVVRNL